MNEMQFAAALVEETRRTENPRLQALIKWCEETSAKVGACKGDVVDLHNHAVISASALLMELRFVEESGISNPPSPEYSPYNRHDEILLMHRVHANIEEKTLTITPIAVDQKGVEVKEIELTPITLPAINYED